MPRLDWTEAADADMHRIVDYIAKENPFAAINVGDEIERQTDLLQTRPGVGRPGRIGETRELVLTGLPYIVCYVADSETVSVLRVLHGSQQWIEEV